MRTANVVFRQQHHGELGGIRMILEFFDDSSATVSLFVENHHISADLLLEPAGDFKFRCTISTVNKENR